MFKNSVCFLNCFLNRLFDKIILFYFFLFIFIYKTTVSIMNNMKLSLDIKADFLFYLDVICRLALHINVDFT